MSIRLLPKRGTKEAEELTNLYKEKGFSINFRQQLSTHYGFANRSSFQESIRKTYGLTIPGRPISSPPDAPEITEEERNPIVQLPPIKLLTYKSTKKRGDEEVAILHASDGHADKITKSYDKEEYKKRMEQMFVSAMTIVKLHRNMYPIRKLIIFNTGDNIQGENPQQGSTVGDVSMGARDQVKLLAAPMWNNVIGSFKQEFEEVEFHGVPGNHGHDKLAPATSSYDLLLYDILEAGIGKHKGIKINVHDDWWAIVELFGIKNFLFHGDGIPCQQGVPFFALDKKLKSWHMQFGGFRYAWSGHFHKSYSNEVSSVLEHFMSSSLTSDDEWALKQLGISSMPSQGLYGLHPRHGITWRYTLLVDKERPPVEVEI